MSDFTFRGLEFHSSRMWRWASVEKSLTFMEKFQMNALIFHQNDLIDQLVLPEAYFSDETMLKRWPVRRSTIFANRVYINRVIQKARKLGIGFYLEVKEIWYPEALVELYPELRAADGTVCPTNPFWFEFLETKMRELVKYMPDLAGVIVSPATRESKISISTNPCSCDRCMRTDPTSWYKSYIHAIFQPLYAHGKTLVVRDFAYSADQQSSVVEAAVSCSDQIVLGLKNVPHDFWPTFPSNPKIGHSHGLRQWIEFDVWGQYCGLGVFPCSLVEDLQQRLQYCRDRGAEGAWFRTDWEICIEASTFNSFNMLNLIGASMLSKQPDMHLDQVYKAWAQHGLYSSLRTESCTGEPVVPTSPQAWKNLKEFMITAWSVMEKSLFVRGNVFQLSSKIHPSLQDMLYIMTKHHNRGNWDPNALDILDGSEEHVRMILEEKQEALRECLRLRSLLDPNSLGVPPSFQAEIETMLELFTYYCKAFYYAAQASFLAHRALLTGNPADQERTREALTELLDFQRELKERLTDTEYPFYLYWLLDEKQLLSLYQDICANVNAIEAV